MTTDNNTITNLKEYDGHEFVMNLQDDASGLKAIVAIHNTNLGAALGGTRMLPYDSEQTALRDVLNLSKAMSYKCALAKLPYGGGKAVILVDEKKNRDAVLFSYARLIEKTRGLFSTGTDVGISDADVKEMAKQTRFMLGATDADRGDLTTSSIAALGVFYAMKAALRQLYHSDSFDGVTVAVKGVGKLGGELVRLVVEAGGVVSVADVDNEKCLMLKTKMPDIRIIPVEEIHRQDTIIYAPCALGNEFTEDTIEELKCKAIVGGANNQLSDPKNGELFLQKGILYAPDYVANAGGLIYVADELEPGGFSRQRILQRTSEIEQTMAMIFEQATVRHKPTSYIADEIALARIQGVSNE